MLETALQRVSIALLVLPVLCNSGCSGGPHRPTDLYLVEIAVSDGRITLGLPENLTDRDGWDNQPAFLPDGESLLYAARQDGEADIYRFDLAARSRARLTQTVEREYSPMPIPDSDGFSVVRVEQDGRRRLWSFDARGGDPSLLLEWEDAVSYYTWIDAELLLVYVESRPSRLRFADLNRGWVEWAPLAEDVGRCIQKVPGRNAVSFVQKVTEEQWWIIEADLLMREKRRLVRTQPGSEDFAWLPSGELLTASGSRVFAWTRESGAWQEIADYADTGLQQITRIAVDPQGRRLILVAERQRFIPPAVGS